MLEIQMIHALGIYKAIRIIHPSGLLNWEQTDRLTFKEAWECPDLVCLKDEKGNETWMFWSADGFYFWGEFDGYQFQTDGVRHAAYINKIAYAAQTYRIQEIV